METFYGEWYLKVTRKHADFSHRFIISGSDSSDGIYDGVEGVEVLNVKGEKWTLRLEWNNNIDSRWQPSAVKKWAEYTLDNGLQITLGADDNFPELSDNDFDDLVMVLRNLNKEIHPMSPRPDAIEFTIPEENIKPKEENPCFK